MRVKDLKNKILELENECERLTDENDSLWFMLDELKSSNIKNFQDNFINFFKKVRDKRDVMRSIKAEEA